MSNTSPKQWVVCRGDQGYQYTNGKVSSRLRNFPKDMVGVVKGAFGHDVDVWFIGSGETWRVDKSTIQIIDIKKVGDKFTHKICNICHVLLPVSKFQKNQTNKHGEIRRPSCNRCRDDIDRRPPKTAQAKAMEKNRPKKGASFQCPICSKRSIAGVTAKIVADHDHRTGDIRDFICESCNTGLGRFKNGRDVLKDAQEYIEERER